MSQGRKERPVHSEVARPLVQIRRQRGEAPFGYFKMIGGLRRRAGRGLAYAAKKTLIAVLGWNLLVVVNVLTRRSPDAPVSALADLFLHIWVAIQNMRKMVRNPRHSARSRTLYKISVRRAALSGGC